MEKEDRKYMQRALELAVKGEGFTSPNPVVGAVVVNNGIIVGEGYHKYYGGPHAEVYALNAAGEKAAGGTIYVTLEPCSHYGKTPPCALKIIDSDIRRAVIALEDPNPEVAGGGIEMLKEAGIEVEVGLLKKEAEKLNEIFLKYITSDLPYVYLKKAQTLDGFTAARSGDSKWITNKKARLEGHKLRHKVDAVLVGIGTVLKDNPSLTTRLEDSPGRDSLRIVLDSKLRISADLKILNQESDAGTLIVCGREADRDKKNILSQKENVEMMEVELNREGTIPVKKLLKKLHKRKISSLLVEGGARVSYSFAKAGLVDKYYYFIAPKLLLGSDGTAAFSGAGPELMKDAKELHIIEQKMLDDNIFLIAEEI